VLGHRVVTRGPERPAATQSAQRQPAAPPRSVGGDGRVGVFRTTGEKPARRQHPGPLALVPLDGTHHPTFGKHSQPCPQTVDAGGFRCDGGHNEASEGLVAAISARDRAGTVRASRWSTVVPRLPQSSSTGRSTLTRYQPSGIDAARARNASRSWRRSRLRTTAEPMRRGVEHATRTAPAAGSGTARSASPPSRTARTVRNRSKPSRRGMRPITPTDGRDPWRVATARRRDHPWSSSACETRVSWHDDACWAGMFVSRLSPDVTYKAIGSNMFKARGVRRASQRAANPDGVISPLCALWKTCYVANPRRGRPCAAHNTSNYKREILHIVWVALWTTNEARHS